MARRYSPVRSRRGCSLRSETRSEPASRRDTAAVTEPDGIPPTSTTAPAAAGLRPPRRCLPPRDRSAWRTPSPRSGTPSTLGYGYLETDVHATRDGVLLAFHDSVLDRVTDGRGALAEATYDEVAAAPDRRPRAGPDAGRAVRRVPRRPLQHRPQVRRRRPAAGRRSSTSTTPATGCWSARSRSAGSTGSAPSPAGRVATSASPLEVLAFRVLPSGRLADRLTRGRVAALQVPHRKGPLTVTSARPGPPGARRGQARARLDHRRPRRDARAARSWCRRPDDRPHRHTQGRARGPRAVEGPTMSRQHRRRRPRTAEPGAGAEGLVLVRLGQLRLRDHRRGRAVRALPDRDRRERRRRRPGRRCSGFDLDSRRPAGVRHHDLHDPLRRPAAAARRGRRPHRAQEGPAGRLRLGRARSSRRCCSS